MAEDRYSIPFSHAVRENGFTFHCFTMLLSSFQPISSAYIISIIIQISKVSMFLFPPLKFCVFQFLPQLFRQQGTMRV